MPGENFINPASIKIDPSLGIVNQGNIDIQSPADISETGEPMMPAAIGLRTPMGTRKQFIARKAGATLAEQFGSPEGSQEVPVQEMQPSKPLEIGRIEPKIQKARSLSVDEMGSLLTPKFRSTPMPEVVAPVEVEVHQEISSPSDVEENVLHGTNSASPLKADLTDLVLRYIQKVGQKDSAKAFGVLEMNIKNWVNGKAPIPLKAAQWILDHSPKAKEHYLKVVERVYIDNETGEGSFSRDHTREDIPVDLCIVTNKDFPPYVHWVFVTATAQYGLGEKMMVDAPLVRGRNLVAEMFLGGKAEWSIWLDHDVLPTVGNAPWWRAVTRDLGANTTVSDRTASYDFIKRMISHKKPYMGGVYTTRRKSGPLVTQPDLYPRNQKDRIVSDATRKNQATGLYGPVEWLAIGFSCIHRVVFETIRKQNQDMIPKTPGEPFPYFNQDGCEGEDISFAVKAKKAGFQLWLDTELFAGHIGRYCFLPGESAYNGPIDFRNANV